MPRIPNILLQIRDAVLVENQNLKKCKSIFDMKLQLTFGTYVIYIQIL